MKRYFPHMSRYLVRKSARQHARNNLAAQFKRTTTKRYTESMRRQFQRTYRAHLRREYTEPADPKQMQHLYAGGVLSDAALTACGYRTPPATMSSYSPANSSCSSNSRMSCRTTPMSIRMSLRLPPASRDRSNMPAQRILLHSQSGQRVTSPMGKLYRKQYGIDRSNSAGSSSSGYGSATSATTSTTCSAMSGSSIARTPNSNSNSNSSSGCDPSLGGCTSDVSDFDDDGADGDDERTPNNTPLKSTAEYGGKLLRALRRRRLPMPVPMHVHRMSGGRYLSCGLHRNIERYTAQWPRGRVIELTVAVYVLRSDRHNAAGHLPRHLVMLGRCKSPGGIVTKDPLGRQLIQDGTLLTGTFTIAVYEGSFGDGLVGNEIFAPFVAEMQALEQQGLVRGCGSIERVVLRAFVCDPLAAALLSCSVQPSDTHGCVKCFLVGTPASSGRPGGLSAQTAFPAFCPDDCERIDEDFRACLDQNFHRGRPVCALLRTVGVCSSVVLDYKHVVCTGVMRRLWQLWTQGRLEYRLNKQAQRQIARQLFEYGQNVPAEFRCGPKAPADWERWTGYDWRQFLLYYGPMVLERTLSARHYMHFLGLHLAVRLMCGERAIANAYVIGFLMRRFVGDYATLYGAENVDHSVHSLLHCESAVLRFGPAQNVDGFQFDGRVDEISRMLGLSERTTADGQPQVIAVDEDEEEEEEDGSERCAFALETIRDAMVREEAAGWLPRPEYEPVRHVNIECTLPFSDYRVSHTQPDNYVVTTRGVMQVCFIQMYRTGCVKLVARKYRTAIIESPSDNIVGDPQQQQQQQQQQTTAVMVPDQREVMEVFDLHDGVVMKTEVPAAAYCALPGSQEEELFAMQRSR